MNKYLKSIITAIICFLFIILFNFILPRLLPGDPIAYLSGAGEDGLTEVQYEAYYKALHLDKNYFVQFWYYIKDIFSGTLGYSYQKEEYVNTLIKERIGITLIITITALVISQLIGLVLGLFAGYHRGKAFDRLSGSIQMIIQSLPSFLIAFLLIIIFAYNGKLPYSGISSIDIEKGDKGYTLDVIKHLILPIATLVLSITPSRYLLVRNTVTKEMDKKYVLYAKERGLSDNIILFKYILPNCIAPFLMMVGMSVGLCIGGSVIIETIFSINGMGRLLSSSIYSLDYPLMQGILFISAFIMVISIIITDILCILIDPKQRRKSHEG